MKITALFRLHPAGWLGLPEDRTTVFPANPTGQYNLYGPTIDSRTGAEVSRGTLSVFRQEDAAIRETYSVRGTEIRVHDDCVWVTAEGDSDRLALAAARAALDAFCRNVMVERAAFMSVSFIQYQDENGEPLPPPQQIEMGRFVVYDLNNLRISMQRAAERSNITDERLDQALMYYEHARFMAEEANARSNFGSGHGRFLVASAYLYFWKALTTVLGDPSVDKDHQRRYRNFGLPDDFWAVQIKPLKRIRDDSDVAHHAEDSGAIEDVRNNIGVISQVCCEVLSKYADHARCKVGEADKNEG